MYLPEVKGLLEATQLTCYHWPCFSEPICYFYGPLGYHMVLENPSLGFSETRLATAEVGILLTRSPSGGTTSG